MSKVNRNILWGSLLIILIFSAACLPKVTPKPPAQEGAGAAGENAGQVQGNQPAGASEDTENVAPQTNTQVPEDVPIMDSAYKLQVARAGAYIMYQVDGTIDDVVTFYQEVLPNYGWQTVSSPDTAMGSTASILRENDVGDKLNIYMQRNDLGGFVSVTIAVQR